jgi:hypothetical protein
MDQSPSESNEQESTPCFPHAGNDPARGTALASGHGVRGCYGAPIAPWSNALPRPPRRGTLGHRDAVGPPAAGGRIW